MSSETADTPIAIKDLHKAFDGQKVLDGVTLQVARGGFSSLIAFTPLCESLSAPHQCFPLHSAA